MLWCASHCMIDLVANNLMNYRIAPSGAPTKNQTLLKLHCRSVALGAMVLKAGRKVNGERYNHEWLSIAVLSD